MRKISVLGLRYYITAESAAPYRSRPSDKKMEVADISDAAAKYTVALECWSEK